MKREKKKLLPKVVSNGCSNITAHINMCGKIVGPKMSILKFIIGVMK